jgi:REP-associated tyrosine transposase
MWRQDRRGLAEGARGMNDAGYGRNVGTNHDASSSVRNRRSIRLRGYDYSQAGAYFITICTQNRRYLFGTIVGGRMVLNDAGRAAATCWLQIPDHFPNVELDEWVVMPNHMHGIVVIMDASANATAPPVGANNVGANNYSPLPGDLAIPDDLAIQRPTGTSRTIGSMVRGFKIGVTKWYRQRLDASHIWQRNYWEHVIRNEQELNHVRRYIVDNPLQWAQDSLRNPTENAGIDRSTPSIEEQRP